MTLPPSLDWVFAVAVVGALTLVWVGYLIHAWRRVRLQRRPVLLAASILGTLPAAYVGATWLGLIAEQYLRLERPLLALPCALGTSWISHRLLRLTPRQSELRRTVTEALICCSALAAALAILGTELGRPLDRLAVVVAIDQSRSIELVPDAPARVRAELQVAELGMRDDDRIGTVVFGAEAAVQDPTRPRSRLAPPQQVRLGRDGTDLGAAMRRALAEVPSDASARIVLLSDGVNTRGDPIGAAAAAMAAGVPVDAVPLDQASLANVRVVAVRMPSRASEGEWLQLNIVTESTHRTPLEVRVSRDGKRLSSGVVEVRAGEDVVTLREQAPGPGLHRYDVALSAKQPAHDECPEDNVGSTFVRVRGESAALVMEHSPELAAPMVGALEAAAFRVHTVGPAGVPADIAAFAAYDLLVLSDIPASDLAPQQLDALAVFVRDLGGGLLLMGGDRSLGPGGYAKTPVEEVSPVSFDLKQERRRASLAEIIAIDYSGSMAMRAGKQTKLELANEAAVRSAQLLGAGDRLGVMHVDTNVQWTLPLAPVEDQAAIAAQIRTVGPGGGGIFVDLTLRTAYRALHEAKSNLKHVLLFADGDDAEQRAEAMALAGAAKQRGITTSVVALGRGSDVAALEQLSKRGDGRFYLIEDAARLPAVFAQETILASRSALNEVVFRPALSSSAAPTRGIDFVAAPSLSGYVVTIPRGRTEVLLRGPEADPVLATWSVGVGRAGVFTSDYKDRWGAAWTSWPGAAQLFAQLGRYLSRRGDDPRVHLETDATGGQLHIRATVVDDDGRAESFRRLVARVRGPDGFSRDVPLEAVGAGAYANTVPLSRPGAFVTTAVDESSDEPLATTGAVLSAGEELRPTGTDRALLSRIADLSGGKLRENLAGVFNERMKKRFSYQSLLRWLTILAACALLLGVAARRLVLPEAVAALPARLHAALRRRPPQPEPLGGPSVAETLLRARRTTAAAAAEASGGSERVAPTSVPRFARGAVAPSEATARAGWDLQPGRDSHLEQTEPGANRKATPPAPGAAQPSVDTGPRSRPLSTAELLLARRRGRR